MMDSLELGLFAGLVIAFVFVGCLATRAKKKTPKTDTPKE
jgi:hypothetical protein